MNITNINRSLAVYQNSAPPKSHARTKGSIVGSSDSITLSETAKDFKIASEAIKNSPDVRPEKVERLKEQMAQGIYTINYDNISESILTKNFDAVSF